MIYTPEYTKQSIEQFKERVKTEKAFCEELFKKQTIRVLAMKYEYYITLNTHFKDITFDLEEKDWYVMGRGLGVLKEDDHSPCVEFDFKHPLAQDAIKLAESWK